MIESKFDFIHGDGITKHIQATFRICCYQARAEHRNCLRYCETRDDFAKCYEKLDPLVYTCMSADLSPKQYFHAHRECAKLPPLHKRANHKKPGNP